MPRLSFNLRTLLSEAHGCRLHSLFISEYLDVPVAHPPSVLPMSEGFAIQVHVSEYVSAGGVSLTRSRCGQHADWRFRGFTISLGRDVTIR
jgi:hypothetical protein